MYNRDILESSAGWNGLEYISDTNTHIPPAGMVFTSIQITADVTIAAITGENITGNTLVGAVIPKGIIIYGRFTLIDFASGTAIVYKGV